METQKYEVLFDFSARNERELSLKKGDVIIVTMKNKNWWRGHVIEQSNCTGFFPSNYVKPHNTASNNTTNNLVNNIKHKEPSSNNISLSADSTSSQSSPISSLSLSSPTQRRRIDKVHVLGEPLPGRYPWSKTFICSCGARLPSPEAANLHIKNFGARREESKEILA